MMPKRSKVPTLLTALILCAHLAASAQNEPVFILRHDATGEPMKPGRPAGPSAPV
jgi:hypothetical protein